MGPGQVKYAGIIPCVCNRARKVNCIKNNVGATLVVAPDAGNAQI